MNFIRSGFRTVRQNPALALGEIAWRWSFGLTAWLLVIFAVRTILTGIDVSSTEITIARTNDAYLIADAIVRVLVQVLPRFAAAMLLTVPLLAVAWTLAATIGRAVTLEALLSLRPDNQRSAILSEGERSASDVRSPRRTYAFRLFFLNCLRAAFTLATIFAFFGTVFLVSAQASTPELAPAYVLVWLMLALLVGCLWGIVNWFLALAPMFIVRDGLGTWKAISASIVLYRDHKAAYWSIVSWFGFFRGAALLVAIVAGMSAVVTSVRAGVIVSVAIALIYFAVADWLYIARLAAYVDLAGPDSFAVGTSSTAPEPAITPTETETETETHSGLS